jgi:7-cyano-7-deazaguanine synthase
VSEDRDQGSGIRDQGSPRRAVVLLSGGLDSYTAAAIARRDGFSLSALSINYGQRHARELVAARAVAAALGVERHLELALDLSLIGGSSLTTTTIAVPKDHPNSARATADQDPVVIPNTYVPARNTIFLSMALGWAEVLGAADIVIGVNALDYSGYPDCRPEFIHAFEQLARLATRAGVEGRPLTIHTPLISMSKADIIRLGVSLGLDYGLTHSCYDPGPTGRPCRHCDSCRLREAGFAEARVFDPLISTAG